MIVKDIMSSELFEVSPDMLVSELGLFLTSHGISGAPVVQGGTLIGVVSLSDLAAHPQNAANLNPATYRAVPPADVQDRWVEEPERQGFIVEDVGSACVRDIMTAAVYTIGSGASLQSLVALLLSSRIHRAIVVDEREKPIGIVTTTDLMRLIPSLLPQAVLAE